MSAVLLMKPGLAGWRPAWFQLNGWALQGDDRIVRGPCIGPVCGV